jgi:hypothetical protein
MKAHGTDRSWVVWNGSLGIVVLVELGGLEADGRASMAPPFDCIGPFDLGELQRSGRLAFGACLIMSRQRWREEQAELRRESRNDRRARAARQPRDTGAGDTQLRDILGLPLDGALEPSDVNAAFRRMAKRAHPDAGGSSERFHRLTEARDILLERVRGAPP